MFAKSLEIANFYLSTLHHFEFKISAALGLILSIEAFFKWFIFSSRSGAGHCCHDDSRDWPLEMKFAPTYELSQGSRNNLSKFMQKVIKKSYWVTYPSKIKIWLLSYLSEHFMDWKISKLLIRSLQVFEKKLKRFWLFWGFFYLKRITFEYWVVFIILKWLRFSNIFRVYSQKNYL